MHPHFDKPQHVWQTQPSFIVSDILFDGRGDTLKESLPYASTGSARTSMTTTPALLTTYSYDSLRRPTSITNIKGAQTHSYDQWEETVSDRKGNIKDFTNDAYGNLAKVEERNGASIYTTNYTWDALDNLTKITDARANVRNFTYDNLSRLTRSEDIHDALDTSFASTTYQSACRYHHRWHFPFL